MPESNPFTAIIRKLEKFYGRPQPPKITDPLELILFENVAYLADDEKRTAAFNALKKKIGTRPEQILKASQKQLEEITRMGGIVPELRAQRLRQIAELVHYIFKDDLASRTEEAARPGQEVAKEIPHHR